MIASTTAINQQWLSHCTCIITKHHIHIGQINRSEFINQKNYSGKEILTICSYWSLIGGDARVCRF